MGIGRFLSMSNGMLHLFLSELFIFFSKFSLSRLDKKKDFDYNFINLR